METKTRSQGSGHHMILPTAASFSTGLRFFLSLGLQQVTKKKTTAECKRKSLTVDLTDSCFQTHTSSLWRPEARNYLTGNQLLLKICATTDSFFYYWWRNLLKEKVVTEKRLSRGRGSSSRMVLTVTPPIVSLFPEETAAGKNIISFPD